METEMTLTENDLLRLEEEYAKAVFDREGEFVVLLSDGEEILLSVDYAETLIKYLRERL